MATVRSLDVAVRANTQHFETGMRKVGLSLRSAVAGLNFVTAAAAAQEKSFLALANTIAIGFATGGPVGAAIAGLGAAVGVVIGKVKEAEKQWEASMEAMRRSTEAVWKEVGQAREKLFELQGGDLLGRRIEKAEMDVALRRASLDVVRRQLARIEASGPFSSELFPNLRNLFGIGPEDEARARLGQIQAAVGQAESELQGLRELQRLMDAISGEESAQAKAKESAEALRKELERIPMTVQVAADSVFALLDGIFVRGMRAQDALRMVVQNIASIGLRVATNAAFGIATP